METVTAWVASVAAVLSLLVAVAVTLAWRVSARRTAAELAELRALVSGLEMVANTQPAEFLITDIGLEQDAPPAEVSSTMVLSATVGEPLVKMAAFAHGLRRALSPENRNRIRFEMRREVRRARKARRAAGRAAAAEARSQATS